MSRRSCCLCSCFRKRDNAKVRNQISPSPSDSFDPKPVNVVETVLKDHLKKTNLCNSFSFLKN